LMCLLIATAMTAYAVTQRVFGREANPFVNGLIANYGAMMGLILAFSSFFLFIFWPWILFIPYRYFSKTDNDDVERADSVLYPLMSAWGMSNLIVWLMDAINDVSLVLFHRSPISASQLFAFVSTAFLVLLSVIFYAIFLVLWHFSMRARASWSSS
jgi:hypothetical protein